MKAEEEAAGAAAKKMAEEEAAGAAARKKAEEVWLYITIAYQNGNG